ncbi:MAG: hypothetical protein MUP66_03705 [Candidatus Nanohaloarchaeota archaeon QJJ-5]|nr:hypothetical protein [Candidatus Nanohaloarchaeota archaeon QJJ-5]
MTADYTPTTRTVPHDGYELTEHPDHPEVGKVIHGGEPPETVDIDGETLVVREGYKEEYDSPDDTDPAWQTSFLRMEGILIEERDDSYVVEPQNSTVSQRDLYDAVADETRSVDDLPDIIM